MWPRNQIAQHSEEMLEVLNAGLRRTTKTGIRSLGGAGEPIRGEAGNAADLMKTTPAFRQECVRILRAEILRGVGKGVDTLFPAMKRFYFKQPSGSAGMDLPTFTHALTGKKGLGLNMGSSSDRVIGALFAHFEVGRVGAVKINEFVHWIMEKRGLEMATQMLRDSASPGAGTMGKMGKKGHSYQETFVQRCIL